MNNKKDYGSNPLRFLLIAKSGWLSEQLWCIWLIISFIVGVLFKIEFLDINKVKISEFIDSSIAGLSFTLIVVSAALDIFKREELQKLYEHRSNEYREEGQLLMELLAPYVFTSLLFLGLGVISILAPLVKYQLPTCFVYIIKFSYIIAVVLGMISLFNVCYDIIINIFNSVRREVIQGNKK